MRKFTTSGDQPEIDSSSSVSGTPSDVPTDKPEEEDHKSLIRRLMDWVSEFLENSPSWMKFIVVLLAITLIASVLLLTLT